MKTIYKKINNDYYTQKSNTVCTLYNPFGEFVGFITRNTAEDCRWLLSREEEFEDLKELAYYMIEQEENAEADYIDGLEDNNAEIERDLAQRAEMGE